MGKRTLNRIVSLRQMADLLGVTERWVNRLAKEKDFPKVARGKYDLVLCVRWYLAYQQRQINNARKGESLQRSEERKASAQAGILEERLAVLRAQVVRKDRLEHALDGTIHALRSNLLGIPKHAAREFAHPELEAFLERFIRQSCEEISTLPDRIPELVEPAVDLSALVSEDEAAGEADGKPVGRPVPATVGRARRERAVADGHR